MLQNKNAIIYGVSESMGGAVARIFARAGARVFLTARSIDKITKIADDIRTSGGKAEVAVVDALDETAVKNHMQSVIKQAGAVDISFNLIGVEGKQNIPLVEMLLNDFVSPVTNYMQTHFITASAAGRQMIKQRSGVILSLTATPGGIGYPLVGGFGPACAAIESFSRDLASELGPHGVRVVNIRSAGSPDSKPFKDAIEHDPETTNHFLSKLEGDTMLKTLPLMDDIGNTALFLASDMAGKITGVTIDVTCGTTTSLNHSVPFIPFVQ